jgi:outer membrane protein assembly factor BamE (lipoprotein component of BamABCDE complex)
MFNLSLLVGCYSYEYYGHYKWQEEQIKQGISKQETIEKLGAPLKLTGNDNIFYYMFSKVKTGPFGLRKIEESKILRLEFHDNKLQQWEVFDYITYVPNETRTPQPAMELNAFSEIIEGIGNVSDIETLKKEARKN